MRKSKVSWREPWRSFLPQLESKLKAKAILHSPTLTNTDPTDEEPGGWCRCCGGPPDPYPSWRSEPWLVYKAGLYDQDRVFYSMLCEGCLEDIRASQPDLSQGQRDKAQILSDLLGDDIDGMQSLGEDLADYPMDDIEPKELQ